MAGISRFSDFEDLEFNQEAFMQGFSHRTSGHGINEGNPYEKESWLYKSFRAGWCDADMCILNREDPNNPISEHAKYSV